MQISNQTIKAILWDMGGVLLQTRDWQRRQNWEKRLNLEKMELNHLVFGGKTSRLASIGKATEDQVWEEVQHKLNLSDKTLTELRADFFVEDKMDPDLLNFIRLKRQTYKIGIISNAWPGVRELLTDKWKIADLFDDIVISAELGIVKPDPRIYQIALQNLQLQPEQAVFVDDIIENVTAAQDLGMKAVHFRQTTPALEELEVILK